MIYSIEFGSISGMPGQKVTLTKNLQAIRRSPWLYDRKCL